MTERGRQPAFFVHAASVHRRDCDWLVHADTCAGGASQPRKPAGSRNHHVRVWCIAAASMLHRALSIEQPLVDALISRGRLFPAGNNDAPKPTRQLPRSGCGRLLRSAQARNVRHFIYDSYFRFMVRALDYTTGLGACSEVPSASRPGTRHFQFSVSVTAVCGCVGLVRRSDDLFR